MTERELLLDNCLAEPADDTARLVYADFLREQPGAYDQRLGEFVWAGVVMSRFRDAEVIEDELYAKASDLLAGSVPAVCGEQARTILSDRQVAWPKWQNSHDRLTITPSEAHHRLQLTYERGMLCGLRLTLARWREVAGAVLTACPLERVEVLDVPGLTLKIGGPGWRLQGNLKLPALARYGLPLEAGRTISYASYAFDRPEFVGLVVRATDDVVRALRSDAGDRWPGPQPEEAT